MNDKILALKWRPDHFDDLEGQDHIRMALKNALDDKRLHQCYLFTGTRGVGKTTIARLLAKGLNCEMGISGKFCGKCESCVGIKENTSLDLIEIDGASKTKIEDIREILDNVQYKPTKSRFKIYIIDEVHMLSKSSFNALLKTLEEPPQYVKFILATTDPQKIPLTVLSRCLQFKLKPITTDILNKQLKKILSHENVTFDSEAISQISKEAKGSLRDALSLTEQAILMRSTENKHISDDLVRSMLGLISQEDSLNFLIKFAKEGINCLLKAIDFFKSKGVDWLNLLHNLQSDLHQVAMYQVISENVFITGACTEEYKRKIEYLSNKFSPQEIQVFCEIIIKSIKDLKFNPTEQIGFEMAILRMYAFRIDEGEILCKASGLNFDREAESVKENFLELNKKQEVDFDPNNHVKKENKSVNFKNHNSKLVQNEEKKIESKVNPTIEKQSFSEDLDKPSLSDSLIKSRNLLRTKEKKKDKVTIKSEPVRVTSPEDFGKKSYREESYESEETITSPEKFHSSHKKNNLFDENQEFVNIEKWCEVIEKLAISKISQQILLNSSMKKHKHFISLFLRESHKQLQQKKYINEIQLELSNFFGEAIKIEIFITKEGITPIERKDFLREQKLTNIRKELSTNESVQFFIENFDAKVDYNNIELY